MGLNTRKKTAVLWNDLDTIDRKLVLNKTTGIQQRIQ